VIPDAEGPVEFIAPSAELSELELRRDPISLVLDLIRTGALVVMAIALVVIA